MFRACVINITTNEVANIIVLEEGANYNPGEGFRVEFNETAEIGDIVNPVEIPQN